MNTLETISELIIEHIRKNDRDIKYDKTIEYDLRNNFKEYYYNSYHFKFHIRNAQSHAIRYAYLCIAPDNIYMSYEDNYTHDFYPLKWKIISYNSDFNDILNQLTLFCKLSVNKVGYMPPPFDL